MDDILNSNELENAEESGSAPFPEDTESTDQSGFDEESLNEKIDYFSQKIKEQGEVQKRLIERYTEQKEGEETPDADNHDKKFIELHQLNSRLESLHQDIKVCELYKKSLEVEIKEYKAGITKISEYENQISALKLEIISLKKERDLLKLGNLALVEESEKLNKYNDEIKVEIEKVLESFKERESFLDTVKSDLELMKNEVGDLSKIKGKLLYDISNLKREVEDRSQKIEELRLEKERLNEKIEEELLKLQNEIESKLHLKNDL